jgi:hypothetical protein
VNDHHTTDAHPRIDTYHPKAAPPQPDPNDHQRERGPIDSSHRHVHNPHHRIPRYHYSLGLPTLPCSGHTHTLPPPLSGRAQATKQHGNKHRSTIPTYPSPPTGPRLGSANMQLETR